LRDNLFSAASRFEATNIEKNAAIGRMIRPPRNRLAMRRMRRERGSIGRNGRDKFAGFVVINRQRHDRSVDFVFPKGRELIH
jgi:hypothetical protein